MSIIVDKQVSIPLQFENGVPSFTYQKQKHQCASMEKVYKFFLQHTNFGTVKFQSERGKSYAHFSLGETEVFDSKRELRDTLADEGGGAWIEERGENRRYFVEEKGWLSSSVKEVAREKERLEKIKGESAIGKTAGLESVKQTV